MRFSKLLLFIFFVLTISCTNTVTTEYPEGQELYRIQVGGKCGFIDEYGRLVIEPQFDRAYWNFSEGVCYAVVGNRKGLIDTKGEFVADLDPSINWVRDFHNGVADFYNNNGKHGLVNKKGVVILDAAYKEIVADENNGFIVVNSLDQKGYVNHEGEFIVPCQYYNINGYGEELMVVTTKGGKAGYVDSYGKWVLDTIFDEAHSFGNGLAQVRIEENWHFINHEGNAVDELNYDEILTGFTDNRAFVKDDDSIIMIDPSGSRISVIDADTVYAFHDGYATFQKNGKFGKIDTTGRISIRPKYDNLFRTQDGLSIFKTNNKEGVVDTADNIIIDAVHERIGRMANCTLLLGEDDNWTRGTYYDRKGQLIWKDMPGITSSLPSNPTKSDYISFFDAHLSDLDPIEGIYYATFNTLAVDRDNGHSSSNGSSSEFYAIMRTPNTDEYIAYELDEPKHWVKKFVQIGESNTYAVVNVVTSSKWAEDGKIILENPYNFEVTLRQGGNDFYNWYVQCEFIKDYPTPSAFEQVQKAEWTGTGFAVADGYVVTNYHVINGAKTIRIKGVDGEIDVAYKAFVVATDREHDLAILKIVDKKFNGFGEIPYAIGKTLPEVGNDIFALGYPMTTTMGNEIKLTNGIISATSGYKGDQSMYQVTAAMQPGNSGGPLFDAEGNVIGINCAKHTEAENASYSIKVSYLFSLVNNSGLSIELSENNKVRGKTLTKMVKQIKPYVYLVECNSH